MSDAEHDTIEEVENASNFISFSAIKLKSKKITDSGNQQEFSITPLSEKKMKNIDCMSLPNIRYFRMCITFIPISIQITAYLHHW